MIKKSYNHLIRLLEQIHSITYLNRWIVFGFDLFLSAMASFLAIVSLGYFMRYSISMEFTKHYMLVACLSSAVSFLIFGTYKGIIRHSSIQEFQQIFKAIILKSCALYGLLYVYTHSLLGNAHILLLIDLLLATSFIICLRAVIVAIYYRIINSKSISKRIIIYGSQADSASLAKFVSNGLMYRYICSGFLTRNKSQDGFRILGQKVNYIAPEDFDKLKKFHEKNRFQAILFPDYKSVKDEKDSLIEFCIQNSIEMFISPPLKPMKKSNDLSAEIKEIEIEDLLGRDEIKISFTEIQKMVSDKIVLVSGAAGSIGSELVRQLAINKSKKIILFDNAESPLHDISLELKSSFPTLDFVTVIGDIRSNKRLLFLFEKYKPQIIFHAAAYKHVPLMENNPCEAIAVNACGTQNIADMAVKYNVEKFIMISTDKAVNPTNVMGASKRIAEIYIQSLNIAIEKGTVKGVTKFITTRFGNVLGSNGSVIPYFKKQIKNGGPVTVTHPDITRYFMTISEACSLVLEAAYMGNGGEIFIFDMGQPVKISILAEKMISLAGLIPNKDIAIEYTGLRPGEKLYEELLANEENTSHTQHKKIKIAKIRHKNYNEALEYFDKLRDLSNNVEITETVFVMKQLVPEFISNNSEFSSLDEIIEKKEAYSFPRLM